VSAPGTLVWFARHESRLAWRDWLAMMTAGRRRNLKVVIAALVALAASMHVLAYSMVGRFAGIESDPDKVSLVVITSCLLLFWALLVSQAMESVTRGFYARSDLDLILTSPAVAQKVFAIRMATMALAVVLMAVLLASPFINVLAAKGGARWIGTYGVVAALGFTAAAVAVALTIALFKTLGPRRTRMVAQIVAAVIGAAFVIGLQIGAVLSYGTLSRLDVLRSDAFVALAPEVGSLLYWPARAMLGDASALIGVVAAGAVLLAGAIITFSPRFGDHVIAAAGTPGPAARQGAEPVGFKTTSPTRALRHKEWKLLLRDPWLMSQSLMQIFYLLPPALLLWRSFGNIGALLVVVPVLVMAAGQLAGGLAWLAISGEDAPDLVATAPVPAGRIMRAKIEAVTGGVAIVFAPFLFALVVVSPFHALVSAVGIALASASATQIQLWFRNQAKRSHFRRRQVSSRMATFAEAFSSIIWAGAAALAAAGAWWHTMVTAAIAAGVLVAARLISPR
jgi:ABC-2 type transport system permease protein